VVSEVNIRLPVNIGLPEDAEHQGIRRVNIKPAQIVNIRLPEG
jgi:hypothetical protein